MALPATPAPRIRPRASRSMFSELLPFRRLVTVLVLARVALLVLSGRVSADVVWPGPDQHRLDHRRTGSRRLDVVVTGSTDLDTDTDPVGLGVAAGLQRSPTVLPSEESGPVPRTASGTLVLTGLIGLLGLVGAATFLVDTIAAPVRRAVRVRQSPADERCPRMTALDELLDPCPEESPTAADVIPLEIEQEAILPAEAPSVLPEIARVVREAARAAAAAAAARAAVPARYAAARSRAVGPTTALWHAVALDRLVGAVGDVCETTVCGSLVRMSTEQTWPVAARDVCPACATVAR